MAAKIKASIQLMGAKHLDKMLRSCGERAWKNGIRRALRAGAKPIRDDAKQLVPVDTGALRKSIASKISAKTKYRNSRNPRYWRAYAVIGPRSDFVQFAAGDKLKRASGEMARSMVKAKVTGLQRPSKYAHLVEFGTVRSRAQSFMRAAYDKNHNQSSQRMRDILWQAISREYSRGARRRAG